MPPLPKKMKQLEVQKEEKVEKQETQRDNALEGNYREGKRLDS